MIFRTAAQLHACASLHVPWSAAALCNALTDCQAPDQPGLQRAETGRAPIALKCWIQHI
jgi:hypothetical protein